jgi:menaquinone-9 beta-reductase
MDSLRSHRFDVVIVGARCAGSALGQRLATAGLSVAILDAARLPSDQPTSTHLVQPPGMDELDALGVGDAVRQASPALNALRLSYDGYEARLPYGEKRTAHCLGRERLDDLLQRAAIGAGAELRPRTKVIEVVRDDGETVNGVVVRTPDNVTERLYADLVVGADGRNSTIAKLVDAEEYLAYEGPRAVYWAYWKRPSDWDPHDVYNTFEGRRARVIFPTDGDRLLIATVPPIDEAREWRRDHSAAYLADIRAYGLAKASLGEDRYLGKVRGVLKPRYFFRASAGPGWALIGDAGHHKEFVVGLGISDALRDARELATAIVSRTPGAVERWWRQRDVVRIEMFHWSRDLGRAQAVDALQRLTAARMAKSPKLHGRFAQVIDGQRSPYGLVPTPHLACWVFSSLLRGETAMLPPLRDAVRRRAQARRDLRRHRRLAR